MAEQERDWLPPPEIPSAAVHRVMANLRADFERRRARRFWWASGVGVAASVAIAMIVWSPWSRGDSSGTAVVAPKRAAAPAAERRLLPDGSVVMVRSDARLSVDRESTAETVRCELHQGGAEFQVAHDPERPFVIDAPDGIRVKVIGTRFVVTVYDDRVSVEVSEGVVTLDAPGQETLRLAAGTSATVRREAEQIDPDGEPETMVSPGERAASERDGERRGTPEPAGQVRLEDDGQDDFGRAIDARRRGDFRRAARLFERFAAHNPASSSAYVANLEAGRIYMDRLGQGGAAVRCFRRVLSSDPSSARREIALSRWVELADRAGSRGCEALRGQYLAEFRGGVHSLQVERACEP